MTCAKLSRTGRQMAFSRDSMTCSRIKKKPRIFELQKSCENWDGMQPSKLQSNNASYGATMPATEQQCLPMFTSMIAGPATEHAVTPCVRRTATEFRKRRSVDLLHELYVCKTSTLLSLRCQTDNRLTASQVSMREGRGYAPHFGHKAMLPYGRPRGGTSPTSVVTVQSCHT